MGLPAPQQATLDHWGRGGAAFSGEEGGGATLKGKEEEPHLVKGGGGAPIVGEVEERMKGFSSAGSWRDIRPPDPLMGEIDKLWYDSYFQK